mgnify:FL=1|jgi:hypothetical protein|tara:strand:+ start:1228 stop:1623 length:396 start_codon:yes stop_codon:yes gene_type:complete
MLSYYISQSNEFVVRTQPTASLVVSGSGTAEDMTLVLQDMMTYSSSYYNLSGSYTYNPYESILTFSQSLEGNVENAQEFIVHLSGSVSGSVYSGTMQVYASQSIDNQSKTVYTTQNEEFISNTTDNDYIVI